MEEKSDVIHAVYERIVVEGPRFVTVPVSRPPRTGTVSPSRCQRLLMARPTGVGRAITTYEMPIEGRDEWLAAVRRLA